MLFRFKCDEFVKFESSIWALLVDIAADITFVEVTRHQSRTHPCGRRRNLPPFLDIIDILDSLDTPDLSNTA
jgi:hypothetical protein